MDAIQPGLSIKFPGSLFALILLLKFKSIIVAISFTLIL